MSSVAPEAMLGRSGRIATGGVMNGDYERVSAAAIEIDIATAIVIVIVIVIDLARAFRGTSQCLAAGFSSLLDVAGRLPRRQLPLPFRWRSSRVRSHPKARVSARSHPGLADQFGVHPR
jgi:hypothetical protein